ncbi:VRR-NUC domain-containing protein [Vibrio sp. Isolate23]|uniref:VRR-NUC domain-containing protein n=1 Tax=Vibrio sp. Isolate23 TaxID=2908533 RepID=UPI001EFE275A|nr:VRR-NUC domain-containing protein [Vibrio sp. Isolate23]MCG9681145.1 VRR-NUC domain-containing protein [Vibrio sp. Isolate23]
MHQPSVLPADYYLNNFLKLTHHAQEMYPDLLSPSERQWLDNFEHLSIQAKCLLVRLLSRKGEWFRSDKLKYDEIDDLDTTLDELNTSDFVTLNPDISIPTLASSLLTKPELIRLFNLTNKQAKKGAIIEALSPQAFSKYNALGFIIIRLESPQVIDVLLALFFANTHQDLSQFVLDELGLHQFEPYQLSRERRFFASRGELDQLLTLSRTQENYLNGDRQCVPTLMNHLAQLATPVQHDYVERKRQHLINDIARDLERLQEYELANRWFEHTSLPPSRERRARIYDKQGNLNAMSDIVTDILHTPYDVSEQEVANRLQQRLQSLKGLKVPRVSKPTLQERHLSLDLSHQRVELAVKEHFEQQGYNVFYSENTLLNGLFGLAFWEVIFSPIEGAFINRYQYRPLDLYQPDFSLKRQSLISHVFTVLEEDGLSNLTQIYQDKVGVNNPFVSWNVFTPQLLENALTFIPSSLLCQLFKIMLQDLKLYRNGLPDLVLFKDGKFEWMEVKGPGDRLQDNQWRWIDHFQKLHVPFSVCYVTNTQR